MHIPAVRLGLCRMNYAASVDAPLVLGGRKFTVADLLAQAQHDIRAGQEATWTLMALSAWLPPAASWTAGDGELWTTERVVQMEAAADIPSAACGGAHRDSQGRAVGLHRRRARGDLPVQRDRGDPDVPRRGARGLGRMTNIARYARFC
jgi:hypothetical protein